MKKLVVLLLLVVSSALAQTESEGPVRLVPYVSPDTPQGWGPFPAIMVQEEGLPTHTVYRPKDLSALDGEKLPIIAWGNGACVNIGNRFRYFLTEIASHGFMAIAIGPIGPKDSELAPQPPSAARQGQAPPPQPAREGEAASKVPSGPDTLSSQLIDAINWAIAENGREGSPYYGKLDTSHIAVMGQSCGGVQAIAVSSDPRIKLTGIWNSGLITRDPNAPAGPAMEDVPKTQLEKLHAPIFYFTGDEANDNAYPNGLDDFQRITAVPVFHAYRDGLPHIGTYREPHGGELGTIAVALLKWQFKGDEDAAKMFQGPECGLCRDPRWHVSKKKME